MQKGILFIAVVMLVSYAGASWAVDDVTVTFDDNLILTNGGIEFEDGTKQFSAIAQGIPSPTGLQGPQGIQGVEGPPGTTSWTDGAGHVTTDLNVGLGVAAPTSKLDVNGTIKATDYIGDGSSLSNIVITEKRGQVFA